MCFLLYILAFVSATPARWGGRRRRVVVDASKLSFCASEWLSKETRIGCLYHMLKMFVSDGTDIVNGWRREGSILIAQLCKLPFPCS
jgi:hypothetical protein